MNTIGSLVDRKRAEMAEEWATRWSKLTNPSFLLAPLSSARRLSTTSLVAIQPDPDLLYSPPSSTKEL